MNTIVIGSKQLQKGDSNEREERRGNTQGRGHHRSRRRLWSVGWARDSRGREESDEQGEVLVGFSQGTKETTCGEQHARSCSCRGITITHPPEGGGRSNLWIDPLWVVGLHSPFIAP